MAAAPVSGVLGASVEHSAPAAPPRSILRYSGDVSRFAFTAALAVAAPAFADVAYFASIEDLPLPPGFVEMNAGWSMAAESGRLTEVRAQGSGDAHSVRRFYVEALPPLGWSPSPQLDDAFVYVRGRERLMFSFSESENGRVLVRARLLVNGADSQGD